MTLDQALSLKKFHLSCENYKYTFPIQWQERLEQINNFILALARELGHELIGKQVKINGAFPQKTGVIVEVYSAGLYHPEELFQITILGNLGYNTSLTRSQFELL